MLNVRLHSIITYTNVMKILRISRGVMTNINLVFTTNTILTILTVLNALKQAKRSSIFTCAGNNFKIVYNKTNSNVLWTASMNFYIIIATAVVIIVVAIATISIIFINFYLRPHVSTVSTGKWKFFSWYCEVIKNNIITLLNRNINSFTSIIF